MTGIICVNKDSGITSFGVVAKVRGILREKKVGHTGTLDPMATGVLPIMVGGATKFLNYLPDSDKGYRAKFILGKTTDTLDITGKVLSENSVNVSLDDVENALAQFVGKINQVPPMFSAKSVDGVRLYDLARQGIEIERKACEVEIKKLQLVDYCNGEYTIDVLCSKGTYIRSLIDDVGKLLGCGAVMTALERTVAMGFTLQDSITLSQLQQMRDNEQGFDNVVFKIESIFSGYQKAFVSPAQAVRFSNGGALDVKRIKSSLPIGETVAVYDNDKFLGLGANDGTDLRVVKLLSKQD